ncbi:hypothetical protein [Micromonospora sp. NPDC023956]
MALSYDSRASASRISYADLAIALLDEIQAPQHLGVVDLGNGEAQAI